jgi:lysophospholipase L1-like esterase
MSRRIVVVVAGILLLGLVAGSGPASAEPDPAPIGRPLYLALGDSLAAGVGASNPTVTGYVPQLYELLRQQLACQPAGRPSCRSLALRNLGVGGATSTTLLATQLPAAVAELQARNNDPNPHNDVRVVTIDIGGNDLFGVVSSSCAAGPTPECAALIQARLQTFAVNFTQILGQLRAAAGPDTVIIAMTYYNPLPSCRLASLAPLADAVLEGAPGVTVGLNDLIRSIAAAHGVLVAETYGQLGPGELVGGDDCLHPNDAGYQVITEAFAAALAEARPAAA